MLKETLLNSNILNRQDKGEFTMRIGEELQAIIDQIGPGINDEKAAGCASLLLQEAGPEIIRTHHRATVSHTAATAKQSRFGFADAAYLNRLGPAVDDETLTEYMQSILG